MRSIDIVHQNDGYHLDVRVRALWLMMADECLKGVLGCSMDVLGHF